MSQPCHKSTLILGSQMTDNTFALPSKAAHQPFHLLTTYQPAFKEALSLLRPAVFLPEEPHMTAGHHEFVENPSTKAVESCPLQTEAAHAWTEQAHRSTFGQPGDCRSAPQTDQELNQVLNDALGCSVFPGNDSTPSAVSDSTQRPAAASDLQSPGRQHDHFRHGSSPLDEAGDHIKDALRALRHGDTQDALKDIAQALGDLTDGGRGAHDGHDGRHHHRHHEHGHHHRRYEHHGGRYDNFNDIGNNIEPPSTGADCGPQQPGSDFSPTGSNLNRPGLTGNDTTGYGPAQGFPPSPFGDLPQPPSPSDLIGSLPNPGNLIGDLPMPPSPIDIVSSLPQPPSPADLLGSLPNPLSIVTGKNSNSSSLLDPTTPFKAIGNLFDSIF